MLLIGVTVAFTARNGMKSSIFSFGAIEPWKLGDRFNNGRSEVSRSSQLGS